MSRVYHYSFWKIMVGATLFNIENGKLNKKGDKCICSGHYIMKNQYDMYAMKMKAFYEIMKL